MVQRTYVQDPRLGAAGGRPAAARRAASQPPPAAEVHTQAADSAEDSSQHGGPGPSMDEIQQLCDAVEQRLEQERAAVDAAGTELDARSCWRLFGSAMAAARLELRASQPPGEAAVATRCRLSGATFFGTSRQRKYLLGELGTDDLESGSGEGEALDVDEPAQAATVAAEDENSDINAGVGCPLDRVARAQHRLAILQKHVCFPRASVPGASNEGVDDDDPDERDMLCEKLLEQADRLNTMPLDELEEMECTLWTFRMSKWIGDEVFHVCTRAIAERRAAFAASPPVTGPDDDIEDEIAALRAEHRTLLRAKLRGRARR